MEDISETQPKKHISIGLLAHVDAGKTTLAECLLYLCGGIRKLGRVDHGDAFLDTNPLERKRGITIFSKQAELTLGNMAITLLDTPGHFDFSAEMERTLQVLDYAILVINGAEELKGHVFTLWKLLKTYHIPVFLFINKMDQEGTNSISVLNLLQKDLDSRCIDFCLENENSNFQENIALCEEGLLEKYLDGGHITQDEIVDLIRARKVFPCYFGSALKNFGVEAFLRGIEKYIVFENTQEEFGGRVFKIARDEQNNRLTFLKVTGGVLKTKMPLTKEHEKVDQIRIYSGSGFQTVLEATAGTICALVGLSKTYAGQGLGVEEGVRKPKLIPVLTYKMELPLECDVHHMFLRLASLEEEEPQLHLVWESATNEIHVQVMGEVQLEILASIIWERFAIAVTFCAGSIVYKETILETVEGIGHFEPLRHYAEVHVLLEPGESGSGLQIENRCSEDILERNWQKQILSHLGEKQYVGVLTGAGITDIKITLLTGNAHKKHTEGGDFRQATHRAVRQGLKKAKSILLEPIYAFHLKLPIKVVGRALTDLQKMHARFSAPHIEGDIAFIEGCAPVALMEGYQREVISYTSGCGRLDYQLKGYEPCHNEEEIIVAKGYDSEMDFDNPTGSVFCSHGAGFVVSWDQVEDYMHVESGLTFAKKEEPILEDTSVSMTQKNILSMVDDKELEAIFKRTYGETKWRPSPLVQKPEKKIIQPEMRKVAKVSKEKQEPKDSYLLVDGYNIIFAWEELKDLAQVNMEGARNKLLDILCNYQGYKKDITIVVFDAYRVEGNKGSFLEYNNIYVVFTKEAETADQYIERTVHKMGRKQQVTVATSDALEQMIILGQGANRLSAHNLKEEINQMMEEIRKEYLNKHYKSKNYLFHNLPEDMVEFMEEVRLGTKSFEE